MAMKVFYAWQSDRDTKLNRWFIKEAVELAIKELNAPADVEDAEPLSGEVEIDHDVKDEPGTAHIAMSIQRKIGACAVFVADLTHVAKYRTENKRTKRTPNGNVLMELGLAIRSVGWERILTVMNLAHGPAEDLPFDLRHLSFPINFTLADRADPELKAKQKKLAHEIAKKLRPTLAKATLDAAAQPGVDLKTTVRSFRLGDGRYSHVRFLTVDVLNDGLELNDLHAGIEVSGDKGVHDHALMDPVGGVPPNPFKTGFSFRFQIMNNDPSKVFPLMDGFEPEQIAIVVESNVREVARIPATKWLDELAFFRNPDPSLPRKPLIPEAQPPRPYNPQAFRDNYRRPKWMG